MLSRLTSDVGELAAELLSSPDKELPPEIEAAIIQTAGRVLPVRILKAVFFSSALGQVRELDLDWYLDRFILGKTSVNGVDIDTIDELDETGLGIVGIAQLLGLAIEVNFDFIFAGLDTSAGIDHPAETANLISGTSNLRGARVRDGQRAQTRAQTG